MTSGLLDYPNKIAELDLRNSRNTKGPNKDILRTYLETFLHITVDKVNKEEQENVLGVLNQDKGDKH